MGNHNIMTTGMSEQISKRISGSPQQRMGKEWEKTVFRAEQPKGDSKPC